MHLNLANFLQFEVLILRQVCCALLVSQVFYTTFQSSRRKFEKQRGKFRGQFVKNPCQLFLLNFFHCPPFMSTFVFMILFIFLQREKILLSEGKKILLLETLNRTRAAGQVRLLRTIIACSFLPSGLLNVVAHALWHWRFAFGEGERNATTWVRWKGEKRKNFDQESGFFFKLTFFNDLQQYNCWLLYSIPFWIKCKLVLKQKKTEECAINSFVMF